ncbi:MAG: antitoxin CcdA [Colwellia sp.]|jgi:antitoxin CcdA
MRILNLIITWRHIMQALYDFNAPKKATNLSLNSDLLKKTRALNINLSATLEQALKDKLKSIEANKWVKENKNAIQAYNDFVDDNGCFGDEFREF